MASIACKTKRHPGDLTDEEWAVIAMLRAICPPSINGASAATYATAKLFAQEGQSSS